MELIGEVMNIGIIVFAYNRSRYLGKVLDGLKENKGVSKLHIFQDGLKCEEHRDEWEKTQQVIKGIDWCEVIYEQSPYNKGLANSIVDGVNTVFEENDAVVVLEDDCVPHPLFMEYVTACLRKYQEDKRVFAVNGYSWNVDVQPNGTDAYFAGRTCAWGWAMWKDRWQLYQQDYKMLARIRNDTYKSRQFDIWGQDLEGYLIGNINGSCDSWAVFRSLKCIELGGLCPTPYYSLIDNIGFDGTGVHCGKVETLTRTREWTDTREIILPDKVEFPENYEIAYADQFRWVSPQVRLNCYNKMLLQWNTLLRNGINIVEYFEKRNIKHIAIWGRGDLCNALICELKDKVEIKYIVESKPKSKQYENIPVISANGITDEIQAVVVIPVYDMNSIQKRISNRNILIGLDKILEYLCTDSSILQK